MRRAFLSLSISLAIAGLLAGCGLSPEARVRDRLVAAGVKPHLADCMAPKLAAKLSTDELKALGRVATIPARDPGHLSFGELSDRLDALGDPHIVDVVTRAGLGCAILG